MSEEDIQYLKSLNHKQLFDEYKNNYQMRSIIQTLPQLNQCYQTYNKKLCELYEMNSRKLYDTYHSDDYCNFIINNEEDLFQKMKMYRYAKKKDLSGPCSTDTKNIIDEIISKHAIYITKPGQSKYTMLG
jgi:hypothetical protein